MTQQEYFHSMLYRTVMDSFYSYGKIIVEHLQKEYGYSESRAIKMLNNLLRVPPIAFECWYFISHDEYVPDEFAENYYGYTAKRINEETILSAFGAFNYMVYLKKDPDNALAALQKGLPRRRLLSPQDVEDLKKHMD